MLQNEMNRSIAQLGLLVLLVSVAAASVSIDKVVSTSSIQLLSDPVTTPSTSPTGPAPTASPSVPPSPSFVPAPSASPVVPAPSSSPTVLNANQQAAANFNGVYRRGIEIKVIVPAATAKSTTNTPAVVRIEVPHRPFVLGEVVDATTLRVFWPGRAIFTVTYSASECATHWTPVAGSTDPEDDPVPADRVLRREDSTCGASSPAQQPPKDGDMPPNGSGRIDDREDDRKPRWGDDEDDEENGWGHHGRRRHHGGGIALAVGISLAVLIAVCVYRRCRHHHELSVAGGAAPVAVEMVAIAPSAPSMPMVAAGTPMMQQQSGPGVVFYPTVASSSVISRNGEYAMVPMSSAIPQSV